MIHPEDYADSYPGPNTIGNIIGAYDKIGLHYDLLRQQMAQTALRGVLVADEIMRAINEEERQLRREHAMGQRVGGCTVVNGPATNWNPEARRLYAAWQSAPVHLDLGPATVGSAHLEDDPVAIISGGSRIIHIEADGTPGEFDGMVLGEYVGRSIPGFDPGEHPTLLIPEERLAPTA